MIHITDDIYEWLRDRICENANPYCDKKYYREGDEFDIEADIHLVIYRRKDGPDNLNPIYDVGIYWVSLRTITEDGESLNDFSISELKKWIIA
jgi:hypothetical protein